MAGDLHGGHTWHTKKHACENQVMKLRLSPILDKSGCFKATQVSSLTHAKGWFSFQNNPRHSPPLKLPQGPHRLSFHGCCGRSWRRRKGLLPVLVARKISDKAVYSTIMYVHIYIYIYTHTYTYTYRYSWISHLFPKWRRKGEGILAWPLRLEPKWYHRCYILQNLLITTQASHN